jgi:hypothetical protein
MSYSSWGRSWGLSWLKSWGWEEDDLPRSDLGGPGWKTLLRATAERERLRREEESFLMMVLL